VTAKSGKRAASRDAARDLLAFNHRQVHRSFDPRRLCGDPVEKLERSLGSMRGRDTLKAPASTDYLHPGEHLAHIFDLHGDSHPHDPGPVRLKELETYFEGCRRHSDADFLLLPGEEANVYLGGHYNILFPKPVYWTLVHSHSHPTLTRRFAFFDCPHTCQRLRLLMRSNLAPTNS
jgi:hypothetical protein